MTRHQEEALERSEGLPMTPSNLERVARATSPEAARWAFGQWELRARAKAKFTRAAEMLFDREALEMATHERVAAYHASLAVGPVVDLTVGIGADLIAFGGGRGFELDAERAELARHNLAVHGVDAEVVSGDCFEFSWEGWVFADPARRSGGRRTLELSEFAPDPRLILERVGLGMGAVKMSPLLGDRELAELGEVQFVSFGGECREALVVFPGSGSLAVRVETGARLEGETDPDFADEPGGWIYDADPAAVRAHALGHFGLAGLGDHPGYLTGEHVESEWLKPYRVISAEPYDPKRFRATLRREDAGKLILKQRGAGLDLQALGKQLKVEGSRELVVLFWKVGPRIWAALASV